jgi:hypothetical protein
MAEELTEEQKAERPVAVVARRVPELGQMTRLLCACGVGRYAAGWGFR